MSLLDFYCCVVYFNSVEYFMFNSEAKVTHAFFLPSMHEHENDMSSAAHMDKKFSGILQTVLHSQGLPHSNTSISVVFLFVGLVC
jgi:hypothetical protein